MGRGQIEIDMELTFDTFQISSISLILGEYSCQISVDRLHSNFNSRADFILRQEHFQTVIITGGS